MRQVYPTFIIKDETDTSGHPYLVNVPDLEIWTEGDTFADAIYMARDAIGLMGITLEDDGKEIPEPSTQEKALEMVSKDTDIVDFTKGILTYVDVDFTEYRRKIDTKAVHKNVTIPSWLNYEAEHAGVNISRILQEALINALGVQQKY